MSFTFAVKNLTSLPDSYQYSQRPLFISGWLRLDTEGARLYDWHSDDSVTLSDPEACAVIRTTVGEYLGGALLQAFVREGVVGLELHSVYWIRFFEPSESGVDRWGVRVSVRPVPPEHDYR